MVESIFITRDVTKKTRNGIEFNIKKLNREIFNTLAMLGLRTSNRGFKYLQKAIETAVLDPDSTDYITKTIYRDVAEMYATNWMAVERAMRHAIVNMAYTPYEEEIFPCANSNKSGRYTNKEFITYIARYITWNYE